MTIYEIKRLTAETEPHFFSRNVMKFFGQRLKDFHVYKQGKKYLIIAESGSNWPGKHYTRRLFNPRTNKLERVE